MKKLIILLIFISVSFTGEFFIGMENPDGKPFTLTIGSRIMEYSYSEHLYNINNSGYTSSLNGFIFAYGLGASHDDKKFNINFKMPISNMLTISGSISSINGIFPTQVSGIKTSQHSALNIYCHLPLYKLWEN